jgi:EAL and modified HD-GYP domain-containing signal transduction protein
LRLSTQADDAAGSDAEYFSGYAEREENDMSEEAFIARQPIVDAEQRIVAYELLFRHRADADSAQVADDASAGVKVLANALHNMGAQWVMGEKLAFINMGEKMIHSDLAELLPPERVVFEILETVRVTPRLIERVKELKQGGYRIALDHFRYVPESEPLLPLADYVKLDFQAHDQGTLSGWVRQIKRHGPKLLAEKVETPMHYHTARALGFEFFQGYYFARPENLIAKVINPSYAHVLDLLNRVRKDAEAKEIEGVFKRDPALTFKLLRYINSVGFGLSCEIQSIRHAVAVLGMQQLYRWLTLLLVTAESKNPPALSKTAIVRGRLAERLGAAYMDKADQDNLFIVGVFSLLPAMLETPMEEILDKLVLPDSITDALLNHTGMYGPILKLVEAVEGKDAKRIAALADELILDSAQVNAAHLEALAWTEQVGV